MRRLMIVLSFAVLPTSLLAQGRGAVAMHAPMAAPRAAVAQAPRAAARPAAGAVRGPARVGVQAARPAGAAGTPIRRAHSAQFAGAGRSGHSPDFYPVPGLGFDVTHVAATRGQRAVGFHRHDHGGRGSFLGAGGYVLYPVTGYADAPEAMDEGAGDENLEGQNDGPADDSANQENAYVMDRQRQVARQPEAASPEPAPSEPPREVQQYVFVKRDGSLIFAVGYSWDRETLLYVTQDGLRRTVESDAIDLKATQQFNEQRGMSFRLPA
jgi:hypothetical protein